MALKYRNKKTIIDGITFDSKKEANRYRELKLLEKAGEISNLKTQPVFVLQEAFDVPVLSNTQKTKKSRQRSIKYVADFQYEERIGDTVWTVVEDVKGMKTQVFQIKKKLFLKKYPQYLFRIT